MFGATTQANGAEAAPIEVDAAILYPEDDGFFGKRAKKARAKLLAGIDEPLRKALVPGEPVRYVTRGCRYWAAEYIFSGQAARAHNLVALVVTDRRLLLVQLDTRGKAGDMKNQIPLAEIRRVAGTLLSGWRLELADGTKEAFVYVPKKDRKRLEPLLVPVTGGAPTRAAPVGPGQASLQHLCPGCLQPVPGKVGATLTCPNPTCRIPFRDPLKAAKLSGFVPGLGDLYLRHFLFGSLEFLGSMVMLGLGLIFVLDAAASGSPASMGLAALMLALFIVIPRVVDYFVTLHMGRKGLVPLALAPAPGAQARNLPSFPRWSPLLFVAGIALTAIIGVAMGEELRNDAAGRAAAKLAAEGKLDEARARWDALVKAGGGSNERKVRYALALLEAGDLAGMDEVRATFDDGAQVEKSLAERWNAALAKEQAVLDDYNEGVQALAEGEEEGLEPLDRALAYFAKVKRPHLPSTRAEVYAHLAADLMAPPFAPEDLETASAWVAKADGAPAAELAAVRSAHAAASGDRDAVVAALSKADLGPLEPTFQLLALEARLRVAGSDAERAEVARAAKALQSGALSDEEKGRLRAILGE
jgi:hypothetical protein